MYTIRAIFLSTLIAAIFLFANPLSVLFPARAAAASSLQPLTNFAACSNTGSFFGFPAWYGCLPHKDNGEINITDINQLWLIVIPIVESLVKAAGYVAVAMIIWGSILFVKSQGDPGKVASARNTIRDAIIGLVIAVSSVAIIQYVADKFQ